MRKINLFYILFLIVLITYGDNKKTDYTIGPNNLIGDEGTVYFTMTATQLLKNGIGEKQVIQEIVSIPNILVIYIGKNQGSIDLITYFFNEGKHKICFNIQFTEILKNKNNHFFLTWAGPKGKIKLYLNGIPYINPSVKINPFKLKAKTNKFKTTSTLFKITDLHILAKYTEKKDYNIEPNFIKKYRSLKPIDVEQLRGKLIYESKLNHLNSIKNWISEGPIDIKFHNNQMVLSSKIPNPKMNQNGHFNLWCPVNFPESFIAEWKYTPMSKHGLTIIHFAAKGNKGKDLFDKSLQKRDGTFKQYIVGDIDNYYITYYSNLPFYQIGRIHGNLRKNKGFYLLDYGPIPILPDAKETYNFRLIKNKNHIQLVLNNKKVYIDYIDSNVSRYGPSLSDGKIGFRQMAQTIGAYSDFKVFGIKKND